MYSGSSNFSGLIDGSDMHRNVSADASCACWLAVASSQIHLHAAFQFVPNVVAARLRSSITTEVDLGLRSAIVFKVTSIVGSLTSAGEKETITVRRSCRICAYPFRQTAFERSTAQIWRQRPCALISRSMARMSDSTSPVRRGGEISGFIVSQRLGTHPGIYPGK